jgi:lipopolysaccharide heptosyltransferase II
MSSEVDIRPGDRLLVSRTDRLGDLVLALPFVESLKARYPRCHVDVLASLYASPILEHNGSIDGIMRVQNDQLLSSRNYCKDLAHKIRQADYQAVVVLYPERHISRLLYQVGIPHRIGTAGRFHSVFFNHRLMHSRKANRKHESEYNLDFLKYFDEGPTVTDPRVYPTVKEVNNARRIIAKAGVTEPFVVVHPGSGGSAERWPMERFIELAGLLKAQGLQVLLTGSLEEGRLIDDIISGAGADVPVIAGDTDLRTLAAVLSLAATVVANSTGPLHLAVAVGTRVVGLYPGRRIMSPVRWGPIGAGHVVIQPMADDAAVDAPPPSMDTITVEQVLKAVRHVYGNALR